MDGKPVVHQYETVVENVIATTDYENVVIKLRKNFITLKDSIFSFGETHYSFYDVSESKIVR
jgi:hypothetical protein